MSEQINLYQAHFRKARILLSATDMVRVIMLLLMTIGVMLAEDVWHLDQLDSQVEKVDREHQRFEAQLTDLKEQLELEGTDTMLEARIRKLEGMLANRLPLKNMLQQHVFPAGNGYANYFLALARQDLIGIWLTGIWIEGAGQELALRGQTVAPELLPKYIQKLSVEENIAGTEFQLFDMRRADGGSALQFLVATTEGEDNLFP